MPFDKFNNRYTSRYPGVPAPYNPTASAYNHNAAAYKPYRAPYPEQFAPIYRQIPNNYQSVVAARKSELEQKPVMSATFNKQSPTDWMKFEG
jgi:hypothetical protein